MTEFEPINRGYNTTFRPSALTLGVVVPIENYDQGPVPTMVDHVERVKLVEELGFRPIWILSLIQI